MKPSIFQNRVGMNQINEPEPRRILVAVATILVLIDYFVWTMIPIVGIILLPFATFGVIFVIVRLAAPFYIKKKVFTYLKKNNGRVKLDHLISYLTPAPRPGVDPRQAGDVIKKFVLNMEQNGIIEIHDSVVIKANWGSRLAP